MMSSLTYTSGYLWKVCALLEVANMRKEKFTISPGEHPNLYLSPLLGEEKHCLYNHLVVMSEWMVHIGRFYICYAVTSLNLPPEDPRDGHLKILVKIIGYLHNATGINK